MQKSMDPRDMREQNPTAEDAIALMRGAGFVVKFGKQTVCYCQSQREASGEAAKAGATAYKITKENTIGRPSQIYLTKVDLQCGDVETISEKISDYVREQMGAPYGPMSPLAKQRVVFTIYPVVNGDKELAYDAYELLYPSSNKEQFSRFWDMIDSSTLSNKPEIKNSTDNINIDSKSNSNSSLEQYAASRGMSNVLSEILLGNTSTCVFVCQKEDVSLFSFEDLLEKARILREIDDKKFEIFMKVVGSNIASRSAERRIGGDVLSMIRNNQTIMDMVKSGYRDGIFDILLSMGYDKTESNELASEIISMGNLIRSINK